MHSVSNAGLSFNTFNHIFSKINTFSTFPSLASLLASGSLSRSRGSSIQRLVSRQGPFPSVTLRGARSIRLLIVVAHIIGIVSDIFGVIIVHTLVDIIVS
jgi:hypothetical protein